MLLKNSHNYIIYSVSNVYLLKDPKALGQKLYEFKKVFHFLHEKKINVYKKALTKFVLKINCILITKKRYSI